MSEPILTCSGVRKGYRSGYPIIRNFSCSMPSGKIIGLLGPNGCGKSTLMKLLGGILIPDSGEICVCGKKRSELTNSFVSYLPEKNSFSSGMRVEQIIKLFSDFYADFDEQLARKMLSDLDIRTHVRMRALSKGAKEKVQLVMVMSRRARLYLLDEPLAGVDPAAREYILNTVFKNLSDDATVIVTTHLIQEIEPVLNEVYFIGFGGRILLSGDVDEIRREREKSIHELFKEVFRCSRS